MSTVRFTLLHAGYCTCPEHIAMQGGARRSIRFPASFALIEHARFGPMLFDTGYSFRFFEATRTFPNRLYAYLTPVTLRADELAVCQLGERGIRPEDVERVFISHFHPDHISALGDFPKARYTYLPPAYESVRGRRGLRALMAAHFPTDIPADFENRAQPSNPADQIALPPQYTPFTSGIDLLGDESLIAVELPGHAIGQMGLIVRASDGEAYFLAADACWLGRAYQENRRPHWLANLIFSDPAAYRETLANLHALHQSQPQIPIIPSHCADALARYGGRTV